ncbi:hypothetical protein RRG08_064025 [Elysia crispata]|uniref:Uncharacterized protein n=1 Tax=Elysia crispata TaxID=231223 RepID=A0AAE0YGE9_9GAST|nr:hypothetical protein RRG08_064025 [Elysia crispata]
MLGDQAVLLWRPSAPARDIILEGLLVQPPCLGIDWSLKTVEESDDINLCRPPHGLCRFPTGNACQNVFLVCATAAIDRHRGAGAVLLMVSGIDVAELLKLPPFEKTFGLKSLPDSYGRDLTRTSATVVVLGWTDFVGGSGQCVGLHSL